MSTRHDGGLDYSDLLQLSHDTVEFHTFPRMSSTHNFQKSVSFITEFTLLFTLNNDFFLSQRTTLTQECKDSYYFNGYCSVSFCNDQQLATSFIVNCKYHAYSSKNAILGVC